MEFLNPLILAVAGISFLYGAYQLFKNKVLPADYLSARLTFMRFGPFLYGAALIAVTGRWLLAVVALAIGAVLTGLEYLGRSFELPKKK